VLRTENSNRSFSQLVAGTVFGITTALLLFASMSANAEDKTRQLAMVRPNPTKIKITTTSPVVAEPAKSSSDLMQHKTTPAMVSARAGSDVNISNNLNLQIDKQTNPDQHNPLVLVRENLNSSHSMVVAAGYGRLWNDQSMLKYISPARQEPGCAYVKASFNF